MDTTQANWSGVFRDEHRDALWVAIAAERNRRDPLPPGGEPGPDPSFVTMSREAGLDAHTVANTLAALLNLRCPTGPRWMVWDRHSLEATVRDEGLCESMEQSLSEGSSTWYRRFFCGPGTGAAGKEAEKLLQERRLALLVRMLARAGRAIIIGRAGVYATQDLPGGIHLRLVAPLERRKAIIAAAMRMSEADAAAELRRVDRERAATHRRFCSGKALSPDYFTVTFNVALVPAMQLAFCLLLLIPEADGGSALPAVPRASTPKAKNGSPGHDSASRPSDGRHATPLRQESLRLAAERYLLEESLIQAGDTRPDREDHLHRLAAARETLRNALRDEDGGAAAQGPVVGGVESMGGRHGN